MRRLGLLILLGPAGCFSDAPSGSGGSTTGGVECSVGSEGCFCTEGGGCDDGLECLQPAGVCVQEGCTPGAALCECANQQCAAPYECIENFCAPIGGGSGSMTSTAEVDSTQSASSPTTDASDSQGTTTASADPSSSAGPDTGATSTTGEPPTCPECLMLARDDDCKTEWDACTGCEGLYDCMYADENSVEQCCADYGNPLPIYWQMFAGCVDEVCSEPCGSIDCGP